MMIDKGNEHPEENWANIDDLIALLESVGTEDFATLGRLSYRIGREIVGDEKPWLAYATSMDAAMTLKPSVLMVSITAWLGHAVVSIRTGSIIDKDTAEWRGNAKTIPVALCIAALRARKTPANQT